MSCLKDNTRLITLLGAAIIKTLTDKSKSGQPIVLNDVIKYVYDNFKKGNASEELAMDAARMAPTIMYKVTAAYPDITDELEKTTPDILMDILKLRKSLLNDDSNFTALKGILGIGILDTSESDALEDAVKKAKTPSLVETVAGKISNIFNGFKTYAQVLINFENRNAPDYLIPKREYVRSSRVKKNIDRLLNNQIAYNDISNSSQLVLPGLNKPGVYLRSMPVKKALELYSMAFKDYRSTFYPDFVNILVDSDGNAIRFDNNGNVNQREGDPVFYAIEDKPLRLGGALVITDKQYKEWVEEFKKTPEYTELETDKAKTGKLYVKSQIFKQVKQRIKDIEGSKYPADTKLMTDELMDQIHDEAIQDVIVFYNNLDTFLNHLKNNSNDVIDNVFVKSGKGFITSNIYRPSKLSSIALPKGQKVNIDVVTAEQTLGSSLVPGNAYIKVPGIDEKVTILRKAIYENPEIAESINSFFTDLLFIRQGKNVIPMSLSDRITYIKQFMMMDYSTITFLYTKDEKTGDPNYAFEKADGTKFYKLKVANYPSIDIKFDNSPEDVAARKQASDYIKTYFNSGFVIYDKTTPEKSASYEFNQDIRDKNTKAKDVLDKARQDEAKFVFGHVATADESKSESIAKQVSSLEPNTIFGYPTGSKVEGKEFEYFLVYRPVFNIDKELANGKYKEVKSKTITPDGTIIEFTRDDERPEYNDFIMNNFSTNAVVNELGNITQVNPSFIFSPTFESSEKINDKLTAEDRAKMEEQVKESVKQDPMTGNNASNVKPESFFDLFDDPSFQKSEQQRLAENKANKVKNAKGLVWYLGSTEAKKDANFKALYNSLSAAEKKELDKELAEARTTPHALSKLFPYEVIFRAVNMQGNNPSAEWVVKGIILYSYYKKSKAEASEIDFTNLYHEAWHGFTQTFLTPEERDALYDEASKKEGSFRDFNGRYVTFQSATKKQLDEFMAEDFRTYMMNGGRVSDTKAPVKNGIFRRLLNFFKQLFGKASVDQVAFDPRNFPKINEIYQKISIGDFSSYNFNTQNIDQTMGTFERSMVATDPNAKITEIGYEDANKIYTTVSSMISTYANELNKYFTERKGKEITSYSTQLMKESQFALKVYRDIKIKFENELLPSLNKRIEGDVAEFINMALKKENIKANQTQLDSLTEAVKLDANKNRSISAASVSSILNLSPDKVADVLKRINAELATIDNAYTTQQLIQQRDLISWSIDNFGDTTDLSKNIDKGVIAYHLKKSKYEITKTVDEEVEEVNDSVQAEKGKNEYDDLSNKQSQFDIAKADIHYILGNIHKYDENNKPVLNDLGVQILEDKFVVWNRVSRLLNGEIDPQEMYNILHKAANFGGKNDLIIKQVLQKLGGISPDMTEASAKTWISFTNVFSMYNNPLFQMNIENKGDNNFKVAVGSVNSIQRKVRQIWANRFRTAEGKHFKKNLDIEADPEYYRKTYLDVISLLGDRRLGNGTSLMDGAAFEFFNAIGVALSDKSEVKRAVTRPDNPVGSAPIIYGRLRDMFARGVTRIYSLNEIFDEFPATKDFKDPLPSQDTNFTELANLETKNSDYTSNYLESNAAGNPQFSLTQHSSLSINITLLNKSKSLRQLLTDYPFMQKYNPLTQPAAAVSIELNSMFDVQDFIKGGEGSRRVRDGVPVQYKTGNVAGLRYIDDVLGDVGVETSKLDPYSKLVFDFHSLAFLNRMEFMTPADKSTRLSSYLTYIEGGSLNGKYYIEPISAYENENGYIAAYSRAAEIMSRYLDGEMGRIVKMQQLQKRISELADGEYIVYDAAYLKQGQEFIVFEDIISDKLLKQIKGYNSIEEASVALNKPELKNEIEQEIIEYFVDQVDQVSKVFNEAPFISEDLIQQTNARAKKFGFSPTKNKTTESLVRSYVLNNWINNYESSIMIFGDPAMYNLKKEEYQKRNAGAQSAKTIPVTNKTIIEYVNNKTTSQKDDNGNVIIGSYAMSLNNPTIKEKPLDLNGRVDTAVLEDSVVDSEKIGEIMEGLLDNEIEVNAYKLKKLFSKEQEEAFIEELKDKVRADVESYKGMKEGDGQGWVAFDFYRRISMLLDIWTPVQNELFNKIINKEEFDVNNVSQFFPVLKLQYWGALGVEEDMLAVNGYHKFSLFPLIPPVIEGTPLEDIHMKMMRDEIDYALFKSGSKIGNLNKIDNTGKAITDKFYLDKKRAINNTDAPFAKNPIFLHFLGNQLNIAPEYKEEVTFPTQMRKIIERGYFLDGVPKDFEITESPATRKAKWDKLTTDKEKAAASKYYEKILTYEKWIAALTKFKTKQLKADLGIDGNTLETKEGRAVVTEKLKTFLVNQLESQDIADHEIDFIKSMQGVLANDLSISLSASKLEKVLNSLVVRRLVRQKINGEALIQISGAGFEKVLRGRLTEEEKALYNPTNDLPYYGYKKGPNGETSLAKCKIALQGSFKALLNLDDINQQPIRTITRLNEMIRNEEWLNTGNNRDMITIIGPRIPTQENNSVELLEVWEFLPELAGNIIVLPSEIVAKSGGDFDIDKITFIFPQLVTKKDMTFWATIEGDRELKRLAVDNLKYATKLNYFNVNSIIDKQREGEKLDKEEQAIFNIIKKATEEFETLYPLDATSEKGIVNNLINSIKDLLVQKVAYASLVTPNSTNVLEPLAKDKLAENVMTYNPKGRFREGGDTSRISGTKIFEVLYNLYKHSSNNIGKDILGIIAVANNYSAIFNRIGFHMNAEWEKGKKDKRSMFMALQHNWIKDDKGNNVISLAGTHDANNEYSIGKIIGQLINGSVDVARDAWIFFMQGYRETIPTVLFMVKAGVPVRQAIYMVAHPLVRAYVKERQLLDSAIAVPLGILSEEDRESSIKKLALKKVLTDPKYGINFSEGAITSRDVYNAGVNAIYGNDQVKEKFNKFSIESNLYGRIKDKNYKTNEFDTAVFLHYLHIEEMGEGVTNLIQKTNFDTNPSLSVMSAAMKEYELSALRADGRFPSEFVDKIITDSPIGSFKIQNFQATLWNPLFNLRHNPVLIDFFVKKVLRKKLDKLAKRNGYQSGEVIDFVNSLLNELPNFILQNSINNFDIDGDTEFKGLQIESALPIKKSTKSNFSVKVAAKDGELTLYLDKEALKAEYNDLLTKGKYIDEVKFDESTKVKLSPINISFFANRQSYYRFVMEREILRAQYPGMQGFEELMKRKDVQKRYEDNLTVLRATKKAEESEETFIKKVKAITYEATLRNLALDNSYNMVKMFLSNESMAHQYDDIKKAYPELENRYSVVKNMEPSYKEDLVDGPKKVSNIVLSDVLLDSDRINIYHENMLELSNPAKIQIDTDDVIERRRVADFFTKLSIYAFLQSGQNTSGMFSLVRFMPQTRYNAIIKPLVKNFEKNMNDLTLERFMYRAIQLYNKPAVTTRYKNWQIDTYNVKADKLIAERGDLRVSELENIAAGIAAFPIAPKDDKGNYTYTGQSDIIGTALRVGPVAAVPGKIKLKIEIAPTTQPSTSVKEGVAELFEENPELANAVYEALGFEVATENIEIIPDVVGKVIEVETVENEFYKARITSIEKRSESVILLKAKTVKGKEYSYLINLQGEAVGTKQHFEFVDSPDLWKGVYTYNVNPQQKQEALQRYSQYLDTIFPDSKVKDIVYHGTDRTFEQFSKDAEKVTISDQGMFFAPTKNQARNSGKNIIKAVINSKPLISDDRIERISKKKKQELLDQGYTGYVYSYNKTISSADDIVVFEPEQIHILGNKQDIEGFKKHIEEGVTVEQDLALGMPKAGTDDSNPLINPLGPKPVSFDLANATAESMRSQVDDLINYFLEAKGNGSTVIFPVTGVGQDLVGVKPQAPTGEINPDTSPLAYQTFLYLSEQLAKHFNYINPNFSQVTAAEPETTVGEKPAEEDEIVFTDEDFKNSFILLDCLYTNS